MSLLSLVLTLRPLQPAAGAPHLGRAAQAVLLDAVRQSEPGLAEEIHAGSGLRPFTASNLIGYSVRKRTTSVSPERTYTLRFTALTGAVARALLAATTPTPNLTPGPSPRLRAPEAAEPLPTGRERRGERGPLAVGATVRLDESLFRVETVDCGLPIADHESEVPDSKSQAPNPQSPHPWAAATSYQSLSAPWLLGRARPESRLSLQFASPTTFKSGEKHVPVPLPGLVFGSLLERWNAFAPVALPAETRRFADECLALTAYELSTRMIPVKEGGLRAGAVGWVRYTALNHDRYWLSLINLLADFALFAGVGAGTGMGLGQCRRCT
ncbi:MAG: CRISPR system precrRNA processing endoribonuclease RAMP protein Cas6 [Anaerolineales bacterium]